MNYINGETTKSEILEIALDIFIENGFNNTHLQDIAKRAKINKGMIYYYFENKDKLYEEVFNNVFIKLLPKMFSILDKDTFISDKLIEYGEAFIDLSVDEPRKLTFLIQEMNKQTDRCFYLIKNTYLINIDSLQKQCNIEAKRGIIKQIDIKDILLAVISFAVFPIVGRNMYTMLYGFDDENLFLEYHKGRKESLRNMIEMWLKP